MAKRATRDISYISIYLHDTDLFIARRTMFDFHLFPSTLIQPDPSLHCTTDSYMIVCLLKPQPTYLKVQHSRSRYQPQTLRVDNCDVTVLWF